MNNVCQQSMAVYSLVLNLIVTQLTRVHTVQMLIGRGVHRLGQRHVHVDTRAHRRRMGPGSSVHERA